MNPTHTFALTLLASAAPEGPSPDSPVTCDAVAEHYVRLAHARYTDALEAARRLSVAVTGFLREPGEESHAAAKAAWLDAHLVYSHAEVFRFGNPNVDAWEGDVNAWPMDEGLIDYVAESYVYHEGNPHALDDIVGTQRMPINDDLIAEYQSGADPKAAPVTAISDIESNVTRGYHAIEFLLWGQDLNETPGESGQRPYTDFVTGDECTNGHCARRRDYLTAATRLLMRDLRFMTVDWQPDGRLYSKTFRELPLETQLERMVVGMGSLSFAELAAERMQVALLTGDQEEEQSCFSDTTHLAILHNARSVRTTYLGAHQPIEGPAVEGPSLADLVQRLDPALDAEMRERFARTEELAEKLARAGDNGAPFDVLIRPDSAEGHELIRALMGALEQQTETLETIRRHIPEMVQL